MAVTTAIASLMAASVRVFRLDFEGMCIDWQLSDDDLATPASESSAPSVCAPRPK
jgi:hypothetical protein